MFAKLTKRASYITGLRWFLSLVLALIITLAAVLSFADPAEANDDRVVYEVSVSPKEAEVPAGDGTVKAKVTVKMTTNQADFNASDFKLYYGGVQTASSDEVLTGGSSGISVSFDVNLTAKELGKAQTVSAEYSYTTSENPDAVPVAMHTAGTFTVKEKSEPYTLTLNPDRTIVEAGGTVNFSGTFTNNSGQATAGGSYIRFAGAYTAVAGSINIADVDISGVADGGTKNFNFSCGSIKGDFTVTPTVVSSGDYAFDAVKIAVKRVEAQFYLVARPKASGQYNDTITIVYTVINNGNVQLSNISIMNENNDRIMTNATTLDPGKTITGSVSMKITGDKTVRYTLKAADPFGRDYQANSNGVDITLETSADDIVLGIVAGTQTPIIQGPEQVTFNIAVSNKSLMAVSDLVVYDDRGEVVQTISTLDPQGVKNFMVVRTIEETQNVFFKVVVTDAAGTEKSFETEVILITVGDEVTVSPTPDITEQITSWPTDPPKEGGIGNALIIALCVVGGLIVVSVAALVIMNILQKRSARNTRRIKRRIK